MTDEGRSEEAEIIKDCREYDRARTDKLMDAAYLIRQQSVTYVGEQT